MLESIKALHTYMVNNCTLVFYFGNTNQGLIKHEHEYSHVTYCSSGSILVRLEDQSFIMNSSTRPVVLLENKWHEIEILEPNTAFVNVFKNTALDNPNTTIQNGIPIRVY